MLTLFLLGFFLVVLVPFDIARLLSSDFVESLDIASKLLQLLMELVVFILLILETVNDQLLVLPIEFVELLCMLIPWEQLTLLHVIRF